MGVVVQTLLQMSRDEDHVWCDALDINVAHILLGRPWLYDLDVTSPGRSYAYEFKFNGKKIVLKPAKPNLIVGSINKRTVTEKNDKAPAYLVTRTHFSLEHPIDGLHLSLEIPAAFSLFP